jgi:preprotein translocase subunit SecY
LSSLLKSIFLIPGLRAKVVYTLIVLALVRLGSHIPIPGIDTNQLNTLFANNGLLGLADLFAGKALSNFSVFAMGILPYINASIIMQLMTILMPQLKEMAEEGESGRKKIAQITRYLTIGLAVIQGTAFSIGFSGFLLPGTNFILFVISSAITLTAGTCLVMWMGELISERGLGNGASLIIFVGIVSSLPSYINQTITLVQGGVSLFGVLLLLATLLLVIVAIVFIQEGQRKISVQYAKRIVGQKMYGGQSTFIPLKINQGGVIPIIFATSVLVFPSTVARFIPGLGFLSNWLSPGHLVYMVMFALFIFFFTYFYTAITFNPVELANNIQKYGGFILGIRPGKPTADYLNRIITRLTFVGALFLAGVAIVPMFVAQITKISSFAGLGGTALLIIVGVAQDFLKQIKTYMVSYSYDQLN